MFSVLQDEPSVHPDLVKDNSQTPSVSQNVEFQEFPNKTINRRIALASSVSAVGLFLSARLDFGVSLKDLSASAIPYEEVGALSSICISTYFFCFLVRNIIPIFISLSTFVVTSYAPEYNSSFYFFEYIVWFLYMFIFYVHQNIFLVEYLCCISIMMILV